MLDPEYLSKCADYLLGLSDNLQTYLAQDIARRIVKTGIITNTAKWQAKQLQESGMILRDAEMAVASFSNESEKEIHRLFMDAGLRSIKYDAKPLVAAGIEVDLALSPAMRQVLEATIAKAGKNIQNLTLTTSITSCSKYLEASNMAYAKVVSGGFSYAQAIADAVRDSAVGGSTVLFTGGGSSQLDVAIRRSVLTGVNQTAAKLTEMYAEDLGVEYYETTAHHGARPSHAVWQGRVFKINGSAPGYPNFADSTGYGTGAGLCGWNCRHSFYPYWPGISKPAYTASKLKELDRKMYTYKGERMTEYECSQQQRAFERSIRESKRILASCDAGIQAASDSATENALRDVFTQESVRLKTKERAMRQFCSATNRDVDSIRTQVVAYKDESDHIVRFGRSTSTKAVWANRKSTA